MQKEKKPKQTNNLLRHEREKRGWSQARLAEILNTDPSMVSRWESGEREPTPAYQEKLCELFNKDAVELGFIEPLPTPTISHSQQVVSSVSSTSTKDLERPDNTNQQEISPISTIQGITLPKYMAGKHSIDFSLPPRIFLDSGLLDCLERAFAPRAKIDLSTLDCLQRVTFELKKQLVRGERTNWPGLLTAASNQLRFLINLLESHSGRGQQLTTFIGETCLLIGDVLFNMRDYQAATRYYEMALRAAQEAPNMALQAIAAGRYGLLLIDSHQYHHARPLIEEALRLAGPNASSVACSWLWAVKAEMYANAGEEKTCLEALEAAREQLGQHEERVDCYTFVAELVPSVYGTAKLLGYEGACYLRLKQPEQAQHVLAASQASSSHPHHQSLVNADFALAFTQQNAPQEACIFVTKALTSVQQTGSTRAFQRILSVREALHPWDGLLEVRELDEQIFLFTKGV